MSYDFSLSLHLNFKLVPPTYLDNSHINPVKEIGTGPTDRVR